MDDTTRPSRSRKEKKQEYICIQYFPSLVTDLMYIRNPRKMLNTSSPELNEQISLTSDETSY